MKPLLSATSQLYITSLSSGTRYHTATPPIVSLAGVVPYIQWRVRLASQSLLVSLLAHFVPACATLESYNVHTALHTQHSAYNPRSGLNRNMAVLQSCKVYMKGSEGTLYVR